MKTVYKMLLGALLGFLGAYCLLAAEFEMTLLDVSFEATLVISGLTIVLIVYCFSGISRMKKRVSFSVSGDEEDELEAKQYRTFTDSTLANTVSTILSIIAIGMAIVTELPIWLILVNVALFIITIISSYVALSVLKLVYPNRNLPSPTDKDYNKKLLAISDEGEKHVMLGGLFHTYQMMNILLTGAMFILIVYSLGANHSQLFSIIVIGVVLILLNANYMFRIRNR
ncbi:DUF3169 family protein [Bacillus pumilus]|uniref:DUF3169 domain-containing protein n=1 Tax=Bacillus pumilus (strain SAFR-032) TaxID=315750 RepID=A8FJ78_BACP2|nr:DUF3169 family protein [Bacillus pumilus]ABV64295.1 hypothetical protein BPUM_3651 [Bacillus pumilus SAFR-032]MBC3643979.1 DUF3169 family protein [Bacillus pumilus]MBC3647401.1 DUF3169 family protein [Bacillus pumilus]MBC3650896.1 DUF3169 family protein [Bacillus pumilus]MBC3654499.1 DUF3169 family protein [Bacillus pumilus]